MPSKHPQRDLPMVLVLQKVNKKAVLLLYINKNATRKGRIIIRYLYHNSKMSNLQVTYTIETIQEMKQAQASLSYL